MDVEHTVKPLVVADYDRGFFELLSHLSPSPKPSREEFTARLPFIPYTFVLHTANGKKIVASARLHVQHRWSYGLTAAAQLEDVVVDPDYRGRGLAAIMIKKIEEVAQKMGCYKITCTANDMRRSMYEHLQYRVTDTVLRKDIAPIQ